MERLRYVLRMQRDHYLPLKVIREHLDAIDRGLEPPPLEAVSPRSRRSCWPATACRALSRSTAAATCGSPASELVKTPRSTEELLEQLEAYGLVRSRPGTGHYDGEALVIARTAAELAAFGIEPRHLRAFKTAADREVGLVEQVVSPIGAAASTAAEARAEEAVARDRRAVGAAARHPGQGGSAPASLNPLWMKPCRSSLCLPGRVG